MATVPTPAHDRTYPIPAPVDDPRFTFGLTIDVARVLAEHGYPPITAGGDLVALQQSLFGFLYQSASSDLDAQVDAVLDGTGPIPAGVDPETGAAVRRIAQHFRDHGCLTWRPAPVGDPDGFGYSRHQAPVDRINLLCLHTGVRDGRCGASITWVPAPDPVTGGIWRHVATGQQFMHEAVGPDSSGETAVVRDPVTGVPLCEHGDDAAACQLRHPVERSEHGGRSSTCLGAPAGIEGDCGMPGPHAPHRVTW